MTQDHRRKRETSRLWKFLSVELSTENNFPLLLARLRSSCCVSQIARTKSKKKTQKERREKKDIFHISKRSSQEGEKKKNTCQQNVSRREKKNNDRSVRWLTWFSRKRRATKWNRNAIPAGHPAAIRVWDTKRNKVAHARLGNAAT